MLYLIDQTIIIQYDNQNNIFKLDTIKFQYMTAEELQKGNLTKVDTKNKIGKLLNMECLYYC